MEKITPNFYTYKYAKKKTIHTHTHTHKITTITALTLAVVCHTRFLMMLQSNHTLLTNPKAYAQTI